MYQSVPQNQNTAVMPEEYASVLGIKFANPEHAKRTSDVLCELLCNAFLVFFLF
jgi:hypothetical protein